MRLRRGVSWVMALSPVIYVGYLSLTARTGSLGQIVFEGDPPGFAERLEAYRPFAALAFDLPGAAIDDDQLHELLAEAHRELPRLESTRYGMTAEQDVRAPVVRAQRRAFEAIYRRVQAHLDQGRPLDAARLSLDGLSVADVMRLGDSGSLSRSTGMQNTLITSIRENLRYMQADQLELLSNKLIAYESKRLPLTPLFRNDMKLLILESAFWPPGAPREDALNLAASALRAAIHGEGIERFVKQSSAFEAGRVRDDVWNTLVGWEVALRSEDQSQRAIRSLIVEVRSRQLALRGEPFNTKLALRLPKEVFALTIQRRMPKLVVAEGHAYLEFTKPGSSVVAFR